ncbi:MAG: hypothetical protein ACOZNI_05485 [Myxococcota bacterium]
MITLALLAACFTPATEPFDWSKQKFENEHTETETLVLQPFEFDDLYCPDGQVAKFFAVYDEAVTTPMPLVVVFHSGSFDYVTGTVDPIDPLAGGHFAGEDRLNAEWASDKVFETFGLLPGEQVDPTEVNTGTLPAALAEQGAFALYPTNCWGDLWHNETGLHANADEDGFDRNGQFMAYAMSRFASTDATTAAAWRADYGLDDLPVTLDSTGMYFVGLGEGGRAIPELLTRYVETGDTTGPTVNGILVDSSCDDLSYYVTNASTFPGYYEGLLRIFGDDLATVSNTSLATWFSTRTPTYDVQVYWSAADPQVPDECNSRLVALAQSNTALQVTNYSLDSHVFLNSDMTSAMGAVSNLLGTAAR